MSLPLKPVKVPLDGILSLQRVDHTIQLGIVYKRADGALNHTVYAVNEDIKQYCNNEGMKGY